MKKFLSALVAVLLVLSLGSAFAAVPSKTTSDLTLVLDEYGTSTGVTPAEGFIIFIKDDTQMTIEELEKLGKFMAVDGNTPVDYFYDPDTVKDEVQNEILSAVNEGLSADEALTLDDMKAWELNEFVTVGAKDYDPAYGDVTAKFVFATPYEVGQKLVGVLGIYDGTRTEVEPNVFEYNVVWSPVKGEVIGTTEEGASIVAMTFKQEQVENIENEVSAALAVLSEPVVAE